MYKCATVGCENTATERITYHWRGDDEPSEDYVCTPCADGYSRRPALQNFTRETA